MREKENGQVIIAAADCITKRSVLPIQSHPRHLSNYESEHRHCHCLWSLHPSSSEGGGGGGTPAGYEQAADSQLSISTPLQIRTHNRRRISKRTPAASATTPTLHPFDDTCKYRGGRGREVDISTRSNEHSDNVHVSCLTSQRKSPPQQIYTLIECPPSINPFRQPFRLIFTLSLLCLACGDHTCPFPGASGVADGWGRVREGLGNCGVDAFFVETVAYEQGQYSLH
mmetsp:Transcript_38349/g.62133  ORF Transcript_38349/g.62133 Transcript_38349/m.62133 type:complete len:227 (+) Transcript_38349:3036-3716(+)